MKERGLRHDGEGKAVKADFGWEIRARFQCDPDEAGKGDGGDAIGAVLHE